MRISPSAGNHHIRTFIASLILTHAFIGYSSPSYRTGSTIHTIALRCIVARRKGGRNDLGPGRSQRPGSCVLPLPLLARKVGWLVATSPRGTSSRVRRALSRLGTSCSARGLYRQGDHYPVFVIPSPQKWYVSASACLPLCKCLATKTSTLRYVEVVQFGSAAGISSRSPKLANCSTRSAISPTVFDPPGCLVARRGASFGHLWKWDLS
jgi:hypothetical protein